MSVSLETPDHACPSCGYEVDRTSEDLAGPYADVITPDPGDLSICVNCGAVNEFDQRLQLRSSVDAKLGDVGLAYARAIRKRGLLYPAVTRA